MILALGYVGYLPGDALCLKSLPGNRGTFIYSICKRKYTLCLVLEVAKPSWQGGRFAVYRWCLPTHRQVQHNIQDLMASDSLLSGRPLPDLDQVLCNKILHPDHTRRAEAVHLIAICNTRIESGQYLRWTGYKYVSPPEIRFWSHKTPSRNVSEHGSEGQKETKALKGNNPFSEIAGTYSKSTQTVRAMPSMLSRYNSFLWSSTWVASVVYSSNAGKCPT